MVNVSVSVTLGTDVLLPVGVTLSGYLVKFTDAGGSVTPQTVTATMDGPISVTFTTALAGDVTVTAQVLGSDGNTYGNVVTATGTVPMQPTMVSGPTAITITFT